MLNNSKLDKHRKNTKLELDNALDNKMDVCINRPCGYGKTYLIIQECQERTGNKLILEPTNALIDHIKIKHKKNLTNNIKINTYSSLLNKTEDDFKNEYKSLDYIFCDEVHRAGAEKWGNGLSLLRKTFPKAQLIGFSATPQRMDGNNVVDSIFNGNELPPLYLADAILQDLLPNPCYVASLYAIDDYFQEQIKFVEDTNRIGKEDKPLIIDELRSSMIEYKKLYNIPNILQKYVLLNSEYRHNMKFIIFIRDVDEIDETKELAISWFSEAFGHMNKKIKTYDVNYLKTRKVNQDITDLFEKNKENDEIDVMISVNMFNEGIHLDNVSGVILLRKTQSDIIYFQQIGRAIDTSGKTPIIFDFVNNYKHLEDGYIALFKKNYSLQTNKTTYCQTESGDIINIHDEGKDFLDLIKIKVGNKEKWRKLEENKDDIKNMLIQKKSFRQISKFYGVSHSLIKSFIIVKFPELIQDDSYTKTYLSDKEIQMLKNNHNNWTIIEAAKYLKRDRSTIDTFSKRTGIKFKQNSVWISNEEKEHIIYLRKCGKTIKEISQLTKRSTTGVRAILNKEGLIKEQKTKPIKKKQKEFLLNNKDKSIEWNIKHTGLNEKQIINFYKKEGLVDYIPKKYMKRRPISLSEIEYIKEHKKDGITKIANALNRSKDFVKKVAIDNNIEIPLVDARRKMTDEDKININKEYHNDPKNFSYKECAKKYNVSIGAIQYTIQDKISINLTEDEVKFIVKNYKKYTVNEFCKLMNRSSSAIRKVLKEHNLIPTTKERRKIFQYNAQTVPEKLREKIIDEYQEGKTSQVDLSKQYNISLYSIQKILETNNKGV